jgi:hypothetical protein
MLIVPSVHSLNLQIVPDSNNDLNDLFHFDSYSALVIGRDINAKNDTVNINVLGLYQLPGWSFHNFSAECRCYFLILSHNSRHARIRSEFSWQSQPPIELVHHSAPYGK